MSLHVVHSAWSWSYGSWI